MGFLVYFGFLASVCLFHEMVTVHGIKSSFSIVSLKPRARKTSLKLPLWFNGDEEMILKYIIIAPEGKGVLLQCENSKTTVACEEGVMIVTNGVPSNSSCSRHARSSYNFITLVVVNNQETDDIGNCAAYPVRNQQSSLTNESTNKDETTPSTQSSETTCACGWSNKKRIVGGSMTGMNEFPYMAAVSNKRLAARYCGASIIGDDIILTAAHCVKDYTAAEIEVIVGDFDMKKRIKTGYEQSIGVKRIIQHEHWSLKKIINDIAIIQLQEKIKMSQKVGPVCLPTSRENLSGKTVIAMGWGLTKTPNEEDRRFLMRVDLKVVNLETCSSKFHYYLNTANPTQMCAYEVDKDTCQGDSGGPLVYLDPDTNRLTQVGIVSYGRTCGSPYPSVNTDVASFMPWIRKTVEALSPGQVLCTKKQ